MQHSFSRIVFVALLSSLLAACGSSPKKDDTPQAEPPPNQLPSGETAPLETEVDPNASPLDSVMLPAERMVYFEYDQSDVRTQDRPILEGHAAFLNANPDVVVRLEGHADERGSREYNLALGERRAMAIARFLNILGVGNQQMQTFSYGEENPLAVGSNESAYQQNRRVEFVYPGGM
jgi:peptidoglycan-associated lipoprotein